MESILISFRACYAFLIKLYNSIIVIQWCLLRCRCQRPSSVCRSLEKTNINHPLPGASTFPFLKIDACPRAYGCFPDFLPYFASSTPNSPNISSALLSVVKSLQNLHLYRTLRPATLPSSTQSRPVWA